MNRKGKLVQLRRELYLIPTKLPPGGKWTPAPTVNLRQLFEAIHLHPLPVPRIRMFEGPEADQTDTAVEAGIGQIGEFSVNFRQSTLFLRVREPTDFPAPRGR